MTKAEAIALVARHAAAFLAAGDFEEATGVGEDAVDDADAARLGEAVETVIGRLHRMGRQS